MHHLVKWTCTPSTVLVLLLSTVLIPATKVSSQATRSQTFGRALTSGQSRGYSGVRSSVKTPNAPLVGGEYVYGYAEIYDDRTGAFMASGAFQNCFTNSYCEYHPLVAFQDISGFGDTFVDTSINLGPGSLYGFEVDYVGNGYWQASILFSNSQSVITSRYLAQNTPMNTVSGNAESTYTSTPIGTVATNKNIYRLGGTSQRYGYCYTKTEKQPTGVYISPCGTSYDWFIKYP